MDKERIAKNQVIFREVNERLSDLGEPSVTGSALELVCECGDTGCTASLSIGVSDYETVRSHPRRFVVVPGHLWFPEAEREVRRGEGYAVLEKVEEAGEVAAEADPRGDGGDEQEA